MPRPKCLNCSGTNLVYRWQPSVDITQKILMNGKAKKLTKKQRLTGYMSIDHPAWIECMNCKSEFDFVTDDKDRFHLIKERG